MKAAVKQSTAAMVVVYPRGQLTQPDKERLMEVGIVAIEADNPNAVAILPQPLPLIQPVQYDDMLMAALAGVSYSNGSQAKFAEDLHRRLKERERAATKGASA